MNDQWNLISQLCNIAKVAFSQKNLGPILNPNATKNIILILYPLPIKEMFMNKKKKTATQTKKKDSYGSASKSL